MSPIKSIELDQLTSLRGLSQKISQALHQRLSAHLRTLMPLFNPRKVLGEFMESAYAGKVPGAEKNFAEIEKRFNAICRDTFAVSLKLKTPIWNIRNQLEVYPWRYIYEFGNNPCQKITVLSPARWVVAYSCQYSLARLLEDHLNGVSLQQEDIKYLVTHNLVLWMLMEASLGLKQLLEDLRFPVSVENSLVSGNLPYIVVTAPVVAFRPPDEVITKVIQLSGRPVFEEVLDVDAIAELEDPVKTRLLTIAR